ncbi:MAG: hypothetical protein HQL38_06895 [Alphaproteobacteria bacterium]|nr:hypothetical protein [Alphaproteobacteria bacterium]
MIRVLAALVFVLVLAFAPGEAQASPHDDHAAMREHAHQSETQSQSQAPAMPSHDGGHCRCATVGGCLTAAVAMPGEPLIRLAPTPLASEMPPRDDRAHQASPIPPLRPPRA